MSTPPIEYRMYLDHDVVICGRFLLCLYNGNQGLYGDFTDVSDQDEDEAVLSVCFAWLNEQNEWEIPRYGMAATLISTYTPQEQCERLLRKMMQAVLDTDLDPLLSVEPYVATLMHQFVDVTNAPSIGLPFDDDVTCLDYSGIRRATFSPLTSSLV